MLVIGHRGAKGDAAENTRESFDHAIQMGVDAIELDVRVTQDNIPVIVHAKKAAVGNHATLHSANPDLLTLNDALDCINRRVPIYIEIKPKVSLQALIDCISERLAGGWQPADFKFLSFDDRVLTVLHTTFPEVPIVVNDLLGFRACKRAKRLGTKEIDVYTPLLTSRFIRRAVQQGFTVYSFPHNDVRKAERWASLGLAGIITDYPARFIGKSL
jgi:glycerophosphoryl diester phosphodiesterase